MIIFQRSLRERCWPLSVLFLVMAPAAPGTAEAPQEPSKPKTHKVEAAPLRVVTTLQGVFAPRTAAEVALEGEVWSDFTVLEAVEHGKHVEAGEVLVHLDTRKIDEAIEELEKSLELAAVNLGEAEGDLALLEETAPLDLKAAERSREQALVDLRRFLDIDRPQSEKSAEFSVETARDHLAYEREELEQLRKMYEADELTDETEEIVLRRQRDAVERAEFSLESATLGRQRTLEVALPRQEESLQETARRRELAWESSRKTVPLKLRGKRLEVERLRRARVRDEERLAKLHRDRAAMELTAPFAGVVYYGRASRGTWPGVEAVAAKLRRGGKLQPHEVILTVVQTRPLVVAALVEEKDLHAVRPGLVGTCTPAGFPGVGIPVTVEKVSAVPRSPGSFDATLLARVEDAPVMPGMTCSARFLSGFKERALAVPPACLFSEGPDLDREYVYVLAAGGKSERRAVRTGLRTAEKVEIVAGIEEGEEVLLERPER